MLVYQRVLSIYMVKYITIDYSISLIYIHDIMEYPYDIYCYILVGGFNPSEKYESQLG